MLRPSLGLAPLTTLAAALFLVVWPLTLQRPGLPYSMKADEPAYYLMARSLWEDHDLRVDSADLQRTHEDFFRPAENLILMTRDGWQTAYYAKPYLFSLLAAPLVAMFGPGGMIALNMGLLLAAAWLGQSFLRRDNGPGLALLFSGSYLFLSAAFAYVFWLQPEILSLFSVTAALYLGFHDFESPGRRLGRWIEGRRFLLAGLVLAPTISAKPPYAVVLIPLAIAAWRARCRLRGLAELLVGTGLVVGAIAAGQQAMTGTWSPYLGTLRRGFNVPDPYQMPTASARAEIIAQQREGRMAGGSRAQPLKTQEDYDRMSQAGTDWSWIFGLPHVTGSRLAVDTLTFVVGRHTGALVFFPMTAVALLLFASGGGARDLRRWGILAAWLGMAVFLLLWNQHNYYGGGGFVGNRYLVPLYPMGLFLVARIRPRALLLLGCLLAGLLLGQIVFAPYGMPVDQPTLQSYTRAIPFRWLPLEINVGSTIPGYHGATQAGSWLIGRKDRVALSGDWLRILGRGEAELTVRRYDRPAEAMFLLRNWAPDNVVTLRLGGNEAVARFPASPPPAGGSMALIAVAYPPPDRRFRMVSHHGETMQWTLRVAPSRAARPSWLGGASADLVGVELLYAGSRDRIDADVYGVEWLQLSVPETVRAGSRFEVAATLVNRSGATWTRDSPVRVHVGYGWSDADGHPADAQALRTSLPRDLEPGASAELRIEIVAPRGTGPHRLRIEPVYEHVRWFGDIDPDARREFEVCIDDDPGAGEGLASSVL